MTDLHQPSVTDTNTAEIPARRPILQHESTFREAFHLWLRNTLLRIVTLGIYHFWAVTRERQLILSKTRLFGEPMEYVGTGMELFKGFLLVMLAYGVPVLTLQYLSSHPADTFSIIALIYIALFTLLIPVGLFMARRYFLSRTVWRGIRFKSPTGN
jgi:uncharacterized membrane protein YjgN (DUF898 family)